MSIEVPYNRYIAEVNQQLTKGGLFLTSKSEKVNAMTIGWGGITVFWGRPIFLVPVRKSRFSHGQIEATGEFTVSVPVGVDLSDALKFCGTKSGRDVDKFAACNLTAQPGRVVSVPVIGECPLHYECKVVYKQDMIPENLAQEIDKKFYPDYHTFYFGEIVACYAKEEL